MEIIQKTLLLLKEGGKEQWLIVDQDQSTGPLFDALMKYKGFTIDRMVKSHQEELAEAEEKMPTDINEEPEVPEAV